MTVMGKSSHALFFNGISDSVICPMNPMASTGIKTSIGGNVARSSRPLVGPGDEEGGGQDPLVLPSFSVEAWIRPDCGGVVASKDGLFKLVIGTVGSPGPALFTVTTYDTNGAAKIVSVTSAYTLDGSSHTGILYPNNAETFIANNTDLSQTSRELLHVAGVFTTRRVYLYINGEVVGSTRVSHGSVCRVDSSDFFIGGKGGKFRGHIESVHWKGSVNVDTVQASPFSKESGTLGLWRFEEPVEVDSNEFYLKSNVSASDTVLTLDTAQVQTLYQVITGKSSTLSGTYSVPSLGDYQVAVTTHTGGAQVVQVPHTTVNLLINPTGTDTKSGKPNSKPPERVRLKTIDSNGTITVESIHLDFDVSSNSGSRGVLHGRTSFDAINNLTNDSTIVLLKSDLLLDPGTGSPLQPPGLGSQAIDKNGMTVIDESGYENHGFLFNEELNINDSNNPYTISNANWAIDSKFQSGHSGRNKFNHLSGHPYLRILPRPIEETITQTVDGMSDIMYAVFDGMHLGISEQVPINSRVSFFKGTSNGRSSRVYNSSTVIQVVRNGLESLDPDRDGIIAIGGAGFDVTPFLLKGHVRDNIVATDDVYNLHMAPETESRIAILGMPDGSDFPYAEIHYSAIDLTGDTIGTSGPALLVEKTVPDGGSVFGSGNTTVAAKIAAAISSGLTLKAPGGLITLSDSDFAGTIDIFGDHNLVGDHTGGIQYEVELDLSMIPSNYSPRVATDSPRSPPLGIESSHSDDSTHPSVYHHLVMRSSKQPPKSTYDTGESYTLTASSGNIGPSNQSTNTFEVFDVIDNYTDRMGTHIVMQPSDRSRTLQLSKMSTTISDPSVFSLEYLMSRGRVSNFEKGRSERGSTLLMGCRGLMDDIASMKTEYLGEGAPESVVVKETKPDAPVVTVTLGGPGQGAVETTPTWDKSPLSRMGWTTRRDGGALVTDVGAGGNNVNDCVIAVAPLNNESLGLAGWGTYMFPPRGRIHLSSGASAEYYGLDATKFYFHAGTGNANTGRYIGKSGTEFVSFAAWVTDTGLKESDNILLDPLFDEGSIVSDGTTINDRLFQSIGSVSHDYQLGTQYASTRALAEIPVFDNQFFDALSGPDNAMKIHLDATLTAQAWAPNPVGRRPAGVAPADRDIMGPYHKRWGADEDRYAVRVTGFDLTSSPKKIYVTDAGKLPTFSLTSTETVRNLNGVIRFRRIFRANGEWAIISAKDTSGTNHYIEVDRQSYGFWENFDVGNIISVGSFIDDSLLPVRDDPVSKTAANEFRRPYYYDRGNVQTQGGNLDYGLRQYVSAVEFKEGPEANPHCSSIESGCATIELTENVTGQIWEFVGDNIPVNVLPSANHYFVAVDNTGTEMIIDYDASSTPTRITRISGLAAAAGMVLTLKAIKDTSGSYPIYTEDPTLNKTWNYPYCPGGLRYGDTIWMNMHYTNPHAMEGLFCKSRGVCNEFLVWNGFNGGRGELGDEARESIPLENFLIGDTCTETANNFVQHINKTVELNWMELGYSASTTPVVAYLDPYLSEQGHARVLLYDVAHDREFIAFHDIHMQVQSGQATPQVNGLDVANGFRSQRKDTNPGSGGSLFIESAYAHRSWFLQNLSDAVISSAHTHLHYPIYGSSTLPAATGRLEECSISTTSAQARHSEEITATYTFNSTCFDTPEGTRAIPAFLCLKGNRANALDLTEHSESRLQHLPHWKDMDFVRRQTIDLGEVGLADGVTNTKSAALEIVRRINQNAALQASSNGGSAHDPAPFWDNTSFTTSDRGTHMGYLRAHIGREVKSLDGDEGFTIVIHSTVPGASGRNFCVWLDNSKGQFQYRPEFLVGHGGRYRNFWCLPPEGDDENMHPAPMPITKNGRPFAPITTLKQMISSNEEEEELVNNYHLGYGSEVDDANDEMATGRMAGTIYSDSFESQGESLRLVEGLMAGSRARARINFGGLVANGVPGWAPDAGKWGFGQEGKSGRLDKIYNTSGLTAYSTYVPTAEKSSDGVGGSDLYGFKFTDHKGVDHTVRLVYRQAGKPFANKNSVLPSTIENEVIIFFDDRDVSQGGFTIGKHMRGDKYPGGPVQASSMNTNISWKGNEWRGIKSPENGYAVTTSAWASNTLTIANDSGQGIHHEMPTGAGLDALGFLGFPDSGLLLFSDPAGGTKVAHYTSRTHEAYNGTHIFYGVTGNILAATGSSSAPVILSPMLNWTTLVTDELLAAAVEYAMSIDPNQTSAFDCSELYTSDGRTYGEWMGDAAKTAIQVGTLNKETHVTPLRDLFSASTSKDWGLYEGTARVALSNANIEAGMQVDTGYIPRTLLNVTTKYRGANANTTTPLLIGSNGNPIDTSVWQQHLRGERYTAFPGDHITPFVENPAVRIEADSSSPHDITSTAFLMGPVGRAGSNGAVVAESLYDSFIEPRPMWKSDGKWALVTPVAENSSNHFIKYDITGSAGEDSVVETWSLTTNGIVSRWSQARAKKFSGVRLAGNTYGEPLTYFRGAQNSPDHSVPLYFGGGFSGMVMDINDGTQNDYTEFYSHPYSSGPTGCSGLQNAGENMGSYALLDTAAMLAMFPGTPLLSQHRGESSPPFANVDAVLPPDLTAGTSAHEMASSSTMDAVYEESGTTGDRVPVTHPSPVVLRFAHPYARYSDTANDVAYVVFGPGQSVPKHFVGETGVGHIEPSIAKTVSEKVTHVRVSGGTSYMSSGTESGNNLPNVIAKAIKAGGVTGNRRYMPPTKLVQKNSPYPYGVFMNWEPSWGAPVNTFNQGDEEDAYLITGHFADNKQSAGTPFGHPFSHLSYLTRWHMDGGYPAGGNWFDYGVRKNPPHPTTTESPAYLPGLRTTTLDSQTITLGGNTSMFRVGSLAMTGYVSTGTYWDDPARDVFVVDATRVQNAEELAATISAAINSYPGEGNLKAIGGTFLPSFQEAVRQDRYSWVNVGTMDAATGYPGDDVYLRTTNPLPTSLPNVGWVRLNKTSGTDDGANTDSFYGYYSSYVESDSSKGKFTLGANYRTGNSRLENPSVVGASSHRTTQLADPYDVFVWSKTGNLRWSNGAPEGLHNTTPSSSTDSIYDQLATTQVHFNGLVDAVDRTRAVGAIGWHGERYSYLNSLKVAKTSSGHGVAAGLGAWHPLLGFDPYGGGMGCHSMNGVPFTTVDNTYTPLTSHSSVGLHPRHFVTISYEGELPIIAKADRDGLILCGDMLDKRWNSGPGGTVIASHNARHNNDRFAAYAHGGPHVDAQYAQGFSPPGAHTIDSLTSGHWAGDAATTAEMYPMETCLFPTGDLFFDKIENPGVAHYPSENPLSHITSTNTTALSGIYAFPFTHWAGKSAARNFFVNHVVWKRMDGGSLCMPAPNARGLGAVPWVWRKVGDSYVKFGETIYGNTRFSFETTNSVMFPTVQAQELAHPQLAEKFPVDIRGALLIPNEEIQFEAITVVDDAGQEHTIEGGSPLGTVVRDLSRIANRDIQGPALAGSGNEPNLTINLPDPNTIPGNIIVRSGFDKVQAYQHETMGTGGMQRPDLPDAVVSANFDSTAQYPSTKPFYENEGWERVDIREEKYPDSRVGDMYDESPLKTSYEPHDRALYFHLTKMGWGYTEREPLGIVSNAMTHNPLTFVSVSGAVLTASGTVTASIWEADQTADGRSFLTVNGHVVSFTGVSGSTFTGCKFTPGFTATSGDTMKPSFYVPAGSTRHFAARRLRDHAEVSGESPDKKPIDWMGVGVSASPATAIRNDRLTPMPIPRMGHHYVTPTMAMMPGHLSHPLYQRAYSLNRAYLAATKSMEQELGYASVVTSLTEGSNSNADLEKKEGVGINALMWFSSPSSPHPPSDIHGGAFTLMVETKVRYDGYGILSRDDENNSGDHRLRLEAGSHYSTQWNFPDPLETGAYQIIIQPNLFAQQLMGFSTNYDFGVDSSTQYPLLTDQQVATVVALQWNDSTYDFILAEALKADVRGCEVYMNEVMLDIDPSPNQQFTSLPPLALYNPLGVNESTSPAWSRKSLPYQPGMFRLASPGYTTTVPWWSPAIKSSSVLSTNRTIADHDSPNHYRKLEHYYPEDYYHFNKSGYGSIGSQYVMSGYPTHFLHPYMHSYMSLSPTTTIDSYATSGGSLSTTNGEILVDNAALFPEVGERYFNHKLVLTAPDGTEHEATYEYRGQASGAVDDTTNRFYGVNPDHPTQFWAACTRGTTLRLTGEFGTLGTGAVYTKKKASVLAHNIDDLKDGSKDTQTGHLPDAYLSMWHYNLGRPMTYYSDSRASMTAAAIDRAPYNHLPEHYETVHYHDFGYVISDGPFDFRGYSHIGWDSGTEVLNLVNPDDMVKAGFVPQARTEAVGSKKYHFGAFWPGGSRFGAQASKMDMWGTAAAGWSRYWDDDKIYRESSTAGQFEPTSASGITDSVSSVNTKRNASFGYRFSVRPPFNRPRAALWGVQGLQDQYSTHNHGAYRPGAYVQSDAVTSTYYLPHGSAANVSKALGEDIASGHSGIIERLTNASAMIGSDLKLQQVRYSQGRRMCRPFGCAVRNIVNDPYAIRHHQGDYIAGTSSGDTDISNRRRNLAVALAHYMTDWWGNTTGEEVRRLPVRGFGIRPAWDPEDAYGVTDRTKTPHTFAAPAGHGHARINLDVFDPGTAKRIGDRGDGRGVRWPTVFNEDILQEVDTIMDATGLVLSHSTTEPSVGLGYVRPRNDDLQTDEINRGISRRLDVAAADGLLKPEAMAGSNVERAKEVLLPASETLQEPISRIAPRIGLDSVTVTEAQDGLPSQHVALGTEAHSLHTDRIAGRRYIVAGGIDTDDNTKAIGDFNLNNLNFSSYKPVMRLNYTHGIWPMGGTLILDLENYMEPVSDLGWGSAEDIRSSNPYQSPDHNSLSYRTNPSDKLIRFLLRPVRVLDHRHVEVFRDKGDALSSTAGGKYGLFTYSTPNAIAATSSKFLRSSNPAEDNPPYAPAYFFEKGTTASGAYVTTSSTGPNIPGTEASGFSNSLKQTVARISISDNTLQHLRADANRNGDYTIQPRYTQSLYPGTNLNKSDHSGESSHADNEVDG